MNKIINNYLNRNKISNPPWDYYFLQNLEEKEYPIYLEKLFKMNTGENLPLKYDFKNQSWIIDKKRCKTFNQKMQWLKLNDATQLKKDCTDKIKVRGYVKERIGEKYLKPVLQICDSFDEIDFEKLPKAFVMKCNHGCKWQYIIKDKNEYLQNKQLVEITKKQIIGWLKQEYWCWGGFEMQYKGIEPKILIEPLLREKQNEGSREIEVYCFNGIPKIFTNVKYGAKREICCYDEKFNIIDLILHPDGNNLITNKKASDLLKQTKDLSKKLSMIFKFVRVDWFEYNNKLLFNELTFTPYSGFITFDKNWNKKLGRFFYL